MDLKIRLNKEAVTLKIIPENNIKSFRIIDKAEADKYGEAEYQLMEGCAYEYKIEGQEHKTKYILSENTGSGIIKPSKIDRSRGRITPGNFVGTLTINLIKRTGNNEKLAKQIPFEVRSIKHSYRQEYQKMLEDITDFCTELLMKYNSPVTQKFQTDFNRDPKILYQQFAFVKSIITSDVFDNAIHRIINSPVTKWKIEERHKDIRRIKKINSSVLRQIMSKTNRIKIENIAPFSRKIDTLPVKIKTSEKVDTNDTVENQFIKHALSIFYNFSANIKNKMKKGTKEYKESVFLENKLGQILNRSFFKSISDPQIIPLNNPVLQRKDGYREVLQIWLKFDLASKLVWEGGGDDVYSAGKRDVASLYEYWIFFKLLNLLSNIFSLKTEKINNLIQPTKNGLGLKLKAGKHTVIRGVYESGVRDLKVEFHYNKTFSGGKKYPASGSWTSGMRPDYTLSIWPSYFEKNEAEEQELIVHIHFDSKYRIKNIKEIMNNNTFKNNHKGENFKREDLIKMHAYKDAIRRTGGAYILYPGDENKTFKGFHEIIPGLGAFALRPSIKNDGSNELKKFILKVVEHFLNRASKRERVSYHRFDIYKKTDTKNVKGTLPEFYNQKRSKPPDEESVLIAGCKNQKQYKWIKRNGLYNFRSGSDRGSLRLENLIADASYILIHKPGNLITGDIWEIIRKGPRIFSREKLISLGYPNPSSDFYLVYEVNKITDDRFGDTEWDIRKLQKYKSGRASLIPFAVTLSNLMQVVS